jgi:hypothetical protein
LISNLTAGTTVPQRLSDTRWSAHAGAVKSLWENYKEIQAALDSLKCDENQKTDTRDTAASLRKKLDSMESAFLCFFWYSVLERFNKTSKTLQQVDITPHSVVKLLCSLKSYVCTIRDQFFQFETVAKTKVTYPEFKDVTPTNKKEKATSY